jgi:hypothetical protein
LSSLRSGLHRENHAQTAEGKSGLFAIFIAKPLNYQVIRWKMLKTAAIEIGDSHGHHAVTCTKTSSFCRSRLCNAIKPIQAETSQIASTTQNAGKQSATNWQKNTAPKKCSSHQHMHTIMAHHPQTSDRTPAPATKKTPQTSVE